MRPMNQRVASFTIFGEPSKVVKVHHAPLPNPRSGHLIVRMSARAINPSDLLSIKGEGHYRNAKLPKIPGFEGIGKVIKTASDVVFPKIGQRVLALRGEGTWQEFTEIRAEEAVTVPDSIPDDIAAQLYINPMTAWLITKQYLIGNDIVIGNAGNSTMSKLFAQFSRYFSFRYIAVTRSDDHMEELKKLGADCVINYLKQPLLATVLNHTQGKLPAVALEAVGGEARTKLAETLRPGGKMIVYGNLTLSPPPEINPRPSVVTTEFWLREWVYNVSVKDRMPVFQELINFMAENNIILPVAQKYDLTQIEQALSHAEQYNRSGKILLTSSYDADEIEDSDIKPKM